MVEKEILYYTDNLLDRRQIGKVVKEHILKANLPIVSVSLRPIDFGRNIHYEGRRSHGTYIRQILTGLKASKSRFVFMCEHDVLYHKSHFDFTPPRDDLYYYNNNVWKYRLLDKKVIGYDCMWLSQCVASRKILTEFFETKLSLIEKKKRAYGFEPGTGQSKRHSNYGVGRFESEYPNVDIRHTRNWTGRSRMDPSEFRHKKHCQNWKETTVDNIPGWDEKLLLSL